MFNFIMYIFQQYHALFVNYKSTAERPTYIQTWELVRYHENSTRAHYPFVNGFTRTLHSFVVKSEFNLFNKVIKTELI